MAGRNCDVCGKPMRLYGAQWKCMTSPGDHKKILDSLDRGRRKQPGQEPTPADAAARAKNLTRKKKKK